VFWGHILCDDREVDEYRFDDATVGFLCEVSDDDDLLLRCDGY